VKKGGIGPCPGYPVTQSTLDQIDQVICKYHIYGLIAGALICWGCGKPYQEAEKRLLATNHQKELLENSPMLL